MDFMSEIPNIKLPKMRSTGDDWCKHYAGFYDRDSVTGQKLQCDVGVIYDSVKKEVFFTTQAHDQSTPSKHKVAYPCFRHQAHLTDGCAKCHHHTPEELAEIHAERDRSFERMALIRTAIEGALAGAKWGSGTIQCPACKSGLLRYSKAAYNGHIHAKCSTSDCAAWME